MAGLLKKITNFKDEIEDSIQEKKNIKILESKGIILTDLRICNSSRDDQYITGYLDKNEKKLYLASRKAIQIGSILVDKFLNLYKVNVATLDKNKLFDEDMITTICDYEDYVPNNPARNFINQNANIAQGFSTNSFSNIGTLILNVEQKATIEQSLTVNQMLETFEDEAKYRYKPVKNVQSFVTLINDILKGLKTINELENKIVQNIIKESSSFFKDIIEMLIKNIKKNVDDSGHYKN